MCTSVALQARNGDMYLGRTMDFAHLIDPELFVFPKGSQWQSVLNVPPRRCRFAVMGAGRALPFPALADGLNEAGLGAATLYFPGYAAYDALLAKSDVPQVAATELITFLLSQCGSVKEAARLLASIRIVGVQDPVTNTVAPLHWILCDKTGACMVVEKTADGLHLLENPIGVLANSPDFSWHMANLRNYLGASPSQISETHWKQIRLTPFGQGAGTFGLPGDFSPPSRFVRVAFQKNFLELPTNRAETVSACFHLLECVSIPKGIVQTIEQLPDYTQYTAFMNLSTSEYFFKTYENSEIVAISLPDKRRACPYSMGKFCRPVSIFRWNS